jgi:hypothetical protein
MVPLAREPSVRFLGIYPESVRPVIHPRARTVARSDGDGLPSPVVVVEWEGVDAKGVRPHVELETCTIEKGS